MISLFSAEEAAESEVRSRKGRQAGNCLEVALFLIRLLPTALIGQDPGSCQTSKSPRRVDYSVPGVYV